MPQFSPPAAGLVHIVVHESILMMDLQDAVGVAILYVA